MAGQWPQKVFVKPEMRIFFSSLILYDPRKVNSGDKGWPGMLLRSFTDLYNDNDNP